MSDPMCQKGGCGERAYCNEAGECLAADALDEIRVPSTSEGEGA